MDSDRFRRALECFDAANSEDPNKEVHEGKEVPKELLYARRMTRWLERLAPEASETLRLAARCQHVRRWKISRSEYPMDREGYRQWRATLQRMHAEVAGEILRDVGYDQESIVRVESLLRKQDIKKDQEAQILEDVICLVFLDHYLSAFAKKHDEDKLLTILRKTWKKMSPRGHEAALALNLPAGDRALLEKALSRVSRQVSKREPGAGEKSGLAR